MPSWLRVLILLILLAVTVTLLLGSAALIGGNTSEQQAIPTSPAIASKPETPPGNAPAYLRDGSEDAEPVAQGPTEAIEQRQIPSSEWRGPETNFIRDPACLTSKELGPWGTIVTQNKTHQLVASEIAPDSACVQLFNGQIKKLTLRVTIDSEALGRLVDLLVRNSECALLPRGVIIFTLGLGERVDLVVNWLVALGRAKISNRVVVSLDDASHQWLLKRGLPSFLLRAVAGPLIHRFLRTAVLRALLGHGLTVIYSSPTSIWLTNPLPFLLQQPHSALFSQGTLSPINILDQWGLVVSATFMLLHPTPFTAELLLRVWQLCEGMAQQQRLSEQEIFNIALWQWKARWQGPYNESYQQFHLVANYRCWPTVIHANLPNHTAAVALLPHHLFMPKATSVRGLPDPLVISPVLMPLQFQTPTQTDRATEVLRKHGVWLLQDGWRETPALGNQSVDGNEWLSKVQVQGPVQLNFLRGSSRWTALRTTQHDQPPQFPPGNTTHQFLSSEMSGRPNVTVYYWIAGYVNFRFAVDINALRDALTREGVVYDNVTVLCFSNSKFLPMLANWLVAMHMAGVDRGYLVVAMDPATRDWLRERDVPHFFVDAAHRYSVLPIRTIVWYTVAHLGFNFVHSDIDAIWLRNPLPKFFVPSSDAMVFTQGTISPKAALDRWRFVLCSGVWFVRSTTMTRRLLYEMVEHQLPSPIHDGETDQDTFNLVLLRAGVEWDPIPRKAAYKNFFISEFISSRIVTTGRLLYNGENSAKLGSGDRAQAPGLSVLPYHLFPRTELVTRANVSHAEAPYIVHLFSVNVRDMSKEGVLRDHGLWFLREDWLALPPPRSSRIDARAAYLESLRNLTAARPHSLRKIHRKHTS